MADESLGFQALDAGLVQPDQTTCGSSVLVVARMLDDPAYAGFVVNGPSPATGAQASGTLQDRFREQVLAMHRLTGGFKATDGTWQVPWPTALGTQPWALAREMTAEAGEKGTSYTAAVVLPGQRSAVFTRLAAWARAGHAVPLYVGNRWSPRHVVLVLPTGAEAADQVTIYDPASGRRYPITRTDFVGGTLDVAGWQVPWFVVAPG